MEKFHPGDLVAYCPKIELGVKKKVYSEIYKVEIGRFKRYSDDGSRCFVYFTEGETAAGCNESDLYKIENWYYINTNLGGEEGAKLCQE